MNSLRALELTPAGEEDCEPSDVPSIVAEEARPRALIFKALADPNRLRLLCDLDQTAALLVSP